MNQPTLAVRINLDNPDHHLWNNHGQWWLHFTLPQPNFTKRRVRRSLGTAGLEDARQIRDFLLSTLTVAGLTFCESKPK